MLVCLRIERCDTADITLNMNKAALDDRGWPAFLDCFQGALSAVGDDHDRGGDT